MCSVELHIRLDHPPFPSTLFGIHTTTFSLQLDPGISLFPQVIPLSPAACLLSPGHFLRRYRSLTKGNSYIQARFSRRRLTNHNLITLFVFVERFFQP